MMNRFKKIIFGVRAAVHSLTSQASHTFTAVPLAPMILLSAFLLLILLLYTCLLLLYRKSWKAIPYYHSEETKAENLFISVVIPARNEEENLPALIKDLQMQRYPQANFEVLIVDDHSGDHTPEIAMKAGGNIRLIKLADHITGPVTAYKKKAIETAVSLAHGSVIVTTDADCRVKPGWLEVIAAYLANSKCNFLVMPVAVLRPKNFFQTFQALDFLSLQGITGAALRLKWHYMCNGANLAYRRDAFLRVNGFEGIDKIASGDDMLLMEKFVALDKDAVRYLKSEEVIVETAAAPHLKAFLQQRARWAGKTAHYNNPVTTGILLLVYLLNLLLLLMPVLALLFRTRITGSFQILIIAWLAALVVKTIAEVYFLQPVAGFFNRRSLLKLFPPAQPFHIAYTVLAGFLGMMGKQNWKGRKV